MIGGGGVPKFCTFKFMLRILTFAVSRLNKSLFNESLETIPLKDPASYLIHRAQLCTYLNS